MSKKAFGEENFSWGCSFLRTLICCFLFSMLVNAQRLSNVQGFSQVKIGGGGQVLNVDRPTAASPLLITTDVGAAYIWNATKWDQRECRKVMSARIIS
jgi:hypothetical protein